MSRLKSLPWAPEQKDDAEHQRSAALGSGSVADAGGSQLHTLIRRDLCRPRLVFSHSTALRREGDGYKSTPGLRIVPGLCLPQPSSGQRGARLLTHFALVLSAAEVVGKVKRPKGEELAKLACLTVFFNDGQDLCKQPGGMRVCIE